MLDNLSTKLGVAITRRAKLDRFFRQVQGRAYAIALSASKNDDTALDIVQEAMLRHVEYYYERAEAEWPPLFFKILATQVANWGRKAQLTGRTDELDDQNEPSHQLGPQREAIAAQQLEQLRAYMHRLSEREYQALVLRSIEGYSTNETAMALECSGGTVKTLLSRAKAKLEGIKGKGE